LTWIYEKKNEPIERLSPIVGMESGFPERLIGKIGSIEAQAQVTSRRLQRQPTMLISGAIRFANRGDDEEDKE
jgi:hypothetical protein